MENHTRTIYEKLGINKATELSAWFFCTKFHIPFDLSPLKRGIIAAALLAVMLPFIGSTDDFTRVRPGSSAACRVRGRRKNDNGTYELT